MSKLFIPLNIQRFAASMSIESSVVSQDVNSNTSVVRITVKIWKSSGSTHWYHPNYRTMTVSCDGQSTTIQTELYENKTSVYTADFTVGHAADGTKSIGYSASIPASGNWGALNASGSATLPTIPRYFTGPISLWVVSYTETSITYGWSTTETCNWVRYHFDGSAGWHDVFGGSATSGTFTVYNGDSIYGDSSGTVSINPASNHYVSVDCRRQDSGLFSSSGNAWCTTYDYPKPTTSPDFTIGNAVSIYVDNPLGRNYNLKLISNVNGTVIGEYSGTINGNVTGFNLEPNKTTMYGTIPSSPSATYYAKVTYSGNVRTKGNGTYSANSSDGPVVDVTDFVYEDINATTLALTGDDQKLINGYSTIQVTIPANSKPTAKYGGSIRGYKIQNGSYTSPSEIPESVGNDVILTCPATSDVIKIIAVDSRSQSGNGQITAATLINYEPIQRSTNFKAERCDAQGNPNGVGEYVKITVEGEYWNNSFGTVTNSIKTKSYTYKNNKSSGDPEPGGTSISVSTTDEDYEISQLVLGDTEYGFNILNTYTIWVTVGDELSETTFTLTLTSGTPLVAYADGGLAIKKQYDTNNNAALQVAGDIDTTTTYNINNFPIIATGSDGSTFIGANNQNIVLRPKGVNDDTNQVYLRNDGMINANGKVYINTTSASSHPAGKWDTPTGTAKLFRDGIGWVGGSSGGNDSGWIRYCEDTANNGDLEIATGDDGNEPIFVRQYNTSNQAVRTLTLLDANGNTTIPGALSVSSDVYAGGLKCVRTAGSQNINSFEDAGSYMHCNRYSGGAKGINWWDSDKRLKGNVKDTKENGLDVINKIEHKSFTKYKEIDKKDVENTYKIGYIANQLQSIDPQLVFGVKQENDIDPILNININVLIPYMTKAIQELSQENEDLKKRIEKLESK